MRCRARFAPHDRHRRAVFLDDIFCCDDHLSVLVGGLRSLDPIHRCLQIVLGDEFLSHANPLHETLTLFEDRTPGSFTTTVKLVRASAVQVPCTTLNGATGRRRPPVRVLRGSWSLTTVSGVS